MDSKENNIGGVPILKLKELALKYLRKDDYSSMQNIALRISIAQAARLSYSNHENIIDYEKDIQLHDRLFKNKHLSCFEHVAKCMSNREYKRFFKGEIPNSFVNESSGLGWCNNFKGFIPYRYLIEKIEKI